MGEDPGPAPPGDDDRGGARVITDLDTIPLSKLPAWVQDEVKFWRVVVKHMHGRAHGEIVASLANAATELGVTPRSVEGHYYRALRDGFKIFSEESL